MKALILGSMLVCAACGGKDKPAETPNAATTTTATPPPPTTGSTERKAVGSSLTVSEDIYRLCHLEAASPTDAAPKFAFDQSLITKEDAVVLDKIAVCMTTGPLAGKRVKLTGRADPRGPEEYNLSLGAHRAHAVADYLVKENVHNADLNETSRGALDATGTDEETWAKDRRVDLALE